jgi:hypothetical protein
MGEPLATEEVERRAGGVLARVPEWIWNGERLPVPVEDVADSCCGLLVRDVEDLRAAPGAPELDGAQSLSGLLLPSLGEIWVNREETAAWPPRRRFTIGHELGHWYMHRDDRGSVFCRSTAVAEVAPDPGTAAGAGQGRAAAERPPLPPHEQEANSFAAALLMPAHLIERHYRETDRDFARLCTLFGASGAAMSRRLRAVIPRG